MLGNIAPLELHVALIPNRGVHLAFPLYNRVRWKSESRERLSGCLGLRSRPMRIPGTSGRAGFFCARSGLIYFSAFYSLLFQIKGLIGPNGILPAGDYLQAVSAALHSASLLVRAHAVLARFQRPRAHARLLGGPRSRRCCWSSNLAARHARHLLRLFSFVRRRGAGFLRLSIRRNVARSRIHLACFSRRRDSGPVSPARIRPRARASSCCNGNGSASISNRAW